jgi:hypothetical protein
VACLGLTRDNGARHCIQEYGMRILKELALCTALVMSGWSVLAHADENLDAELDAEWGNKRIRGVVVESEKDRYLARLTMIDNRREANLARCRTKGTGTMYCSNLVEEEYRRETRALEKEFASRLDELPKREAKAKGFNR